MPRPIFALLFLIACTLVAPPPLGVAANAAPAQLMASAALTIAAKKKKKKKKKRKKKRKKGKKKGKRGGKGKRRARKETPAPLKLAVIVPFDGEERFLDLAEQIAAESASLDGVATARVTRALVAGDPRFRPPVVKQALRRAGSSNLVRGAVRTHGDHVEILVVIHSSDGAARWFERYVTGPGVMDHGLIASLIAEDVDELLPEVSARAPIALEQIVFDDTAPPRAQAEDALLAVDVDAEPPEPGAAADAEAVVEPGVGGSRLGEIASIRGGSSLLYWSYTLDSPSAVSAVRWHPLDPSYGASVGAGLWPHPFIGVEAGFDFGLRSFGASFPNVMPRVDVSTLAFSGRVLGRYLLALGVGTGAHVGYRYLGNIVSSKIDASIFPAYASHLLVPGVDLYVSAARPWLDLHLSGDLVPWGVFLPSSEPRPSPAPLGLWGWRLEAALRSLLPWSLSLEARMFYESYYLAFESSAASPTTGEPFGPVKISNGLRGISLGVGWRY